MVTAPLRILRDGDTTARKRRQQHRQVRIAVAIKRRGSGGLFSVAREDIIAGSTSGGLSRMLLLGLMVLIDVRYGRKNQGHPEEANLTLFRKSGN